MSIEEFFGCQSSSFDHASQQLSSTTPCSTHKLRDIWTSHSPSFAPALLQHHRTHYPPPFHSPRIPQTLHFIWLGPSPIPTQNAIESFRNHHPTWSIRLWQESDILSLPLQNRSAFQSSNGNYGLQSDIARYEILFHHGGVYVDMDYVCTDSFDDLVTRYEFFCGASNTNTIEVNNGLIGCRKGHWLMNELIDRIRTWHEIATNTANNSMVFREVSQFLDPACRGIVQFIEKDHKAMEAIEHTGPGLLTRVLCDAFVSGEHDMDLTMVFPAVVFHPFPNRLRYLKGEEGTEGIVRKFMVNGETKAVHLWARSWQ